MSRKDIRLVKPHETYGLRHSILRPHQPIEACRYDGDFSPSAFHIGGFLNHNIVCILSGYEEVHPDLKAQKPFRLRAMATAPHLRRQGWAKDALLRAEQEVRARGGDLIWFNAREVAFPFYVSMGYDYFSDMFEIVPIGPHKVMGKYLKR